MRARVGLSRGAVPLLPAQVHAPQHGVGSNSKKALKTRAGGKLVSNEKSYADFSVHMI